MKKYLLVLFILGFSLNLYGEEGFCRKCHLIREYNKKNHANYDYYDDYLKDVDSGKVTPDDPDFILEEAQKEKN